MRRTPRVRRWAAAIVWACVALYWLYIWRLPIWSVDDLVFATRSGTTHGGIAWDRVWPLLVDDVNVRVGRSADMAAQFVFSAGPLVGVLMATFCFLESFALWRLLRAVVEGLRGSGQVLLPAVGMVAAITIPMSLVGTETELAGSTVMFMSANVGYVLGAAMLFAAVTLLWRCRESSSATLWRFALVVLFACVVAIHHEELALGVAGAVLGLAVVTRRRDWRPSWGIGLLVVLGVCIGRYAAGGLWNRQSRLLWPVPIDGLSAVQAHRVLSVFAVSEALRVHPQLYACLCAASVALGWALRRRVEHPRMFTAALATLVLGAAAVAVLARRVRRDVALHPGVSRARIYSGRAATLLLLATAVVVAALVVVVLMMRRVGVARIVVPLTGMMLGLYSLPVLLGTPYGRTLYVPMMMCVVVTVAMAMVTLAVVAPAGVTRPARVNRAVVTAVACLAVAASIGPAVRGTVYLTRAVDANTAAWRPVVEQVEAAKRGRTATVVLPRDLPYPKCPKDYHSDRASYRENFATFQDLPASVAVIAR